MGLRISFALLVFAALSGCGGGGGSDSDDEFVSGPPPLVVWTGSANGERIIDASNDTFGFYADSGCLYNFQTGRENRDFCLTSGPSTAKYGSLFMRIVNIRAVGGRCVAGLVQEETARFIDIEIDAYGREIVFVTANQPEPCY